MGSHSWVEQDAYLPGEGVRPDGGDIRVIYLTPTGDPGDGFRPLAGGGALPSEFEVLVIPDQFEVWIHFSFVVYPGQTPELRLMGVRIESAGEARLDGLDGGYRALESARRDIPAIKQRWVDAAVEYALANAADWLVEPDPGTLRRRKKRGPAGPSEREVAEVVALRQQGYTFAEIADRLPITKSTAARWYAAWQKRHESRGDAQ